MDVSFDGTSWWSYVLVFVTAATPVLEVLVVVPAAVLGGMHPVPATLLALAGNLTTVVLAVVAGDRVLAWWRGRRPARTAGPGRKAERARRLARRWGVPALAFLAPVSTGTHLAALAALATGASQRRVLGWMTAGLAVWAAVVGAAAAAGTQLL